MGAQYPGCRYLQYWGPAKKCTFPTAIPGASEMPPQVPGKSRQVMAQKILQQSREAESALADALVSLPPGGGVLVSTYHVVHVHLNIIILSKQFIYIKTTLLYLYHM